MSLPEQQAWDSIQPMLRGFGLDPKRVENVLANGHPDVDYTHGNIELKHISGFPKRSDTPVNLPLFTAEQQAWLAGRWASGGNAWLLTRVGKEWFLFDGWTAIQVRKGITALDWSLLAAFHYPAPKDGWRGSPATPGAHAYSRQLNDWLRFDLARMMPGNRARALRLRAMKSIQQAASELDWTPEYLVEVEQAPDHANVDILLSHWQL